MSAFLYNTASTGEKKFCERKKHHQSIIRLLDQMCKNIKHDIHGWKAESFFYKFATISFLWKCTSKKLGPYEHSNVSEKYLKLQGGKLMHQPRDT